LVKQVVSRHLRVRPERQHPLNVTALDVDDIAIDPADAFRLQLGRVTGEGGNGGPATISLIRPFAPRPEDGRVTGHHLHLSGPGAPAEQASEQPLQPVTLFHRVTSFTNAQTRTPPRRIHHAQTGLRFRPSQGRWPPCNLLREKAAQVGGLYVNRKPVFAHRGQVKVAKRRPTRLWVPGLPPEIFIPRE